MLEQSHFSLPKCTQGGGTGHPLHSRLAVGGSDESLECTLQGPSGVGELAFGEGACIQSCCSVVLAAPFSPPPAAAGVMYASVSGAQSRLAKGTYSCKGTCVLLDGAHRHPAASGCHQHSSHPGSHHTKRATQNSKGLACRQKTVFGNLLDWFVVVVVTLSKAPFDSNTK